MGELQKSLLSVGLLLPLLLLLWLSTGTARTSMAAATPVEVPVGVILDLNSTLGQMVNNTLAIALEAYYLNHTHTSYKINLQVRNVSENDVVAAADEASDLIENYKVHAILGPQNSEQARYIVELGKKFQIPVIWFPLTGPSLLSPPSPSSDKGLNCYQFHAIADTIQALGWQSIIPIYEQTEYGSYLIPCLTNVLKSMGIQMANVTVIDSSNPTDFALINRTLDSLNNTRTRAFLVHMSMDFGARFMKSAQERDMIDEGYGWILTQGLSSLTDPKVPILRTLYHPNGTTSPFVDNVRLRRYMQGALGVRPMDDIAKKTNFRRGIERNFSERFRSSLTIYGWWAYHTLEALAMAVEKVGTGKGLKLGSEIRAQIVGGNSGVMFNLSSGQLDQSKLEVYNVIGERERIIGSWSPEGLAQNFTQVGDTSSGEYKLKDPLWPGDTLDKPPKLRIGVPRTNSFPEFLNVDLFNSSKPLIYGFAVNVFLKALDLLPFPLKNYEFVHLPSDKNHTPAAHEYDDILCNQMKEEDLDAVIGDITIVANRTACVDFTLPYLYSSVAMVVRVKEATTSKGVLLKPFHWLLWLILGGIFVAATIVIIILERKKTNDGSETKSNQGNKTSDGSETKSNQGNKTNEEGSETNRFRFKNPFLVYKMDALEFGSRSAGWMMILTSLFFILVIQVYTANLASNILTQGKMREAEFKDENETKSSNNKDDLCVGYRKGSWVRGLLIEQIGFKENQLKALGSREEYNAALSSKKVRAIFDETPYLTLFLSRYKSQFMMTGPIYKTGGFAFAFPKKSSLARHFSDAILNVTEDVEAYRVLMAKSSLPTSIEDLDFEDENDIATSSLSIDNFGGLWPVLISVVALFLGLAILNPSAIQWLRAKLLLKSKS